jgi:hypothetical protein
MKKLALAIILGFAILAPSACAKKAPVTTPAGPAADTVLKAAQQMGAIVGAAQAGEAAYYASGVSHITPADQATVNKGFADLSQAVLTAIDTYSAAKTAANKQALVDAVVKGVNSLVTSFGHLNSAQLATYTASVSAAVAIFQIVAASPAS